MSRQAEKSWFSFERLKQYNLYLILLIVVLFVASLYSVNTASAFDTSKAYLSGATSPIVKHIAKMIGGVILLVLCSQIPANRLRIPLAPAYLLVCIFLVVMLVFWGKTINGATRWWTVPLINVDIQPSEFVKLGVIMLYAFFAAEATKIKEMTTGDILLYYGIPTALALLLIIPILLENISTGLIFIAFILAYLFILRMPFVAWLKVCGAIALLGVVSALVLYLVPKEYIPETSRFYTAKERMIRKVNANPEDEFIINDKNRQEQYGKIALANSRLFIGQGVGGSKMKDILPMANSDYVYAVLVEEVGLIALLGIPALYVAWFLIAGVLAKREKNPYCKFILYGIGLIYPLQALVNIVVVSGVFTTGQPLPFLSAGGSSMFASCIALGLMLSISKRQYQREQEDCEAKKQLKEVQDYYEAEQDNP